MKWPLNREGALLEAPVPLIQSPQSNSRSAIPQPCRHRFRRVQFLPPGHVHHAKEICDDCDAFVGWAPKLETLERANLNFFKLSRLAMHPGLTEWERRFVKSISAQKRLSPKQQAVFDKLCVRYLEGKAS